ncbi:hypothetical protein [Hymenobacter siberiensis]|uniref:hypothetical protein n=1 Tax=Hymenobacter siberiensis TaxID=2848396 RepID=UPI001D014DB3|nr:hypothetical protein [Hymenobacter siberiensis]
MAQAAARASAPAVRAGRPAAHHFRQLQFSQPSRQGGAAFYTPATCHRYHLVFVLFHT